MEENRTDYEPNFVLKDAQPQQPSDAAQWVTEAMREAEQAQQTEAEPQASSVWRNHASESPIAENTSYVKADTYFGEERPEATPQPTTPTEEEGLYVDPREKFRSNTKADGTGASARWGGGKARAESSPASSGFVSAGFGGGSDGGGGFRNKGRKSRRPSEPVTLTKKTLALLVACCMAISCLFGLGGGLLAGNMWNGQNHAAVTTETADVESAGEIATTGYNLQNATGSNLTIQEITKTAQKSVVEIKTEGAVSDSWMQQYVTEGAGSGVIISKDGYIMTNNHVIENANKITVTTYDKHSYEATLVGTDKINDVAVLKIKATGLTPAVYGNSDQLQVGDMAVAIGNPLGELGGTVTAGIISAKDRELSIDGKTMKLLQTDSSINPGNSGGGLFNGDGQLIGLVVAKSAGSDVEGLGFAIPINTAASVAQQLMDQGYVSGQPWTGMTYTEGSSGLDFIFGGSSGATVYIYSVDTKTAKEAGFKPGDVVFAVEDRQITSIDDLTSIISAHKVGDRLVYTIVRDGQTMELTITLQEKTKEQSMQ